MKENNLKKIIIDKYGYPYTEEKFNEFIIDNVIEINKDHPITKINEDKYFWKNCYFNHETFLKINEKLND